MYLISGMHRSGTSLVARLFYEAGADMGDAETFYRPDKWNPDGYFEQPDIHAINMPLINGYWWKFAYFWLPSTQTILKRAQKRARQIEKTAALYQERVVKETRFCLTLPAWVHYGAQIHGILACIREPFQVARSLQKRNHISIRHALRLWRLHNLRLLENADNIPLAFVAYDNVLQPEKFQQEMAFAFRFFGCDVSEEKIMELRQKCVKPRMNHYVGEQAQYPEEMKTLWAKLCERHAQQFS